MNSITNFSELTDYLRKRGQRSRVAVVWAADETTQSAVERALEAGFVEAIFIGARQEIEANHSLMRHAGHFTVVDAPDCDAAAAAAVAMVREGRADVLMKGMLNTDNLLRAVLNRECGILPKGAVLMHITAAEIPNRDRILFFTDAAVIPYPTDEQREAQLAKILYVCRALGIDEPRVALIHCTEKVDERHFPFTAQYRSLCERAKAGEFGPCIVDGPLDLKTALDAAALAKKHIDSPLQGRSDALIFPDIEAGNVFYKTLTLFAHATTAGILQGTMAPVVVPSRGDSVLSKYYSLALAAL